MNTNFPIANFYLSRFSASSFWFLSFHSFVSEFPYRLLSVSIPVILYSSIPVLIIPVTFHHSPFSFLLPGSSFPCGVYVFSSQLPALPEARHTGAIYEMGLGTSRPPPPFLLFPFAANFRCGQSSLTFHLTL